MYYSSPTKYMIHGYSTDHVPVIVSITR